MRDRTAEQIQADTLQRLNDGGSAFPSPHDEHFPSNAADGMSLRDYFAGQALNGMLVHMVDWRAIGGEPAHFAEWAYELADAMLKERAK